MQAEPTRTAKGLRELRRGQILEVARALVAEEGLSALTFGRLEGRLAFSRGVITHHFRNKEDIVEAVLDSALAEIDQATLTEVEAAQDHAAKLSTVVQSVVRGFLDHLEASRILVAFWGRIPSDSRAAKLNAALYRRYRKAAAALVADGQRGGAFRTDVDPETVATLMVGAVIGIVTQAFFEPGAIDVDAACEEAALQTMARLALLETPSRS